LKGLLLSRIGAAFRVEFSTERAGKQIRWQQSKRLLQGTVVALTPSSDMFRTNCKIAIVAARPIQGGLDQNPPTVDMFWGDSDDAIIDPVDRE
jgi:helicase required for RNAi-mediated heterochromatin assembly 1